MSEDAQYQVLLIGLEPKAQEFVEAACAGASFTRIHTGDEFMEQYEGWHDGMFNAIMCGSATEGMPALEVAQVLLNQCPESLKLYITVDTTNYEPRNLLKNGFTQCFALPMDSGVLRQMISERVLAGPKKPRSYRSVRIFDLEGGGELDFDTYVYLPLNKKYVRFTGAKQAIEGSKLEKLQSRQMTQVFVDHREMNKFYQFSAQRLRALGDESGTSSTEKQEKLKDAVRGLFNDIFDISVKSDFDQGREMIQQCESIISNYITKGASSSWYKKLMASVGESNDTYNHASNVSTFAALFAIGLGHAAPEDLAMAGLFHDLGMATLPDELQNKKESELTEEEKAIYYTHPEKSVNIIKNKRLILTEKVEKAILQHHEKFNGKGYPKQMPGFRLTDEAQILSFADQFDYLTRLEPGRPRLTPLQAFEEIKRSGSINPDILSQIRKLLDRETSISKTA